jgi:MOSC domain-containing protein
MPRSAAYVGVRQFDRARADFVEHLGVHAAHVARPAGRLRPGQRVGEAQHDRESSGAQAEEYWPDMEGLEYRDTVTEWELPAGTFFDLAVVHLLTTATIERLRALYPEGRFEVRRFRPNIVVATASDQQGFVENGWIGRTLAIGDEVRLRITGPCPRCVMTTLPQGDLPKDAGILRTAAQNNEANVGVYADVVKGGSVRRGDDVTLA